MKKPGKGAFLVSAAVAAVLTAATLLGLYAPLDRQLGDALYQSPRALEGNIVIVGIDDEAIDAFGPYQTWSREVVASALERLNADGENRPAAIGVDVVYSGRSDRAADERLVDAAGAYGNVVMASFADIGPALVERPDGTFHMDEQAVLNYNAPFDELAGVAETGHINAMYDTDGVVRQAFQYLELPDGKEVPSFNAQLAALYAEAHGLALRPPPLSGRGSWHVAFSAGPGAYSDGISLADVVAGDIPPEFFAGKIVLIGPYTPGLLDYVLTPIDRAEVMYGVEFQANAIDALLRGDFKQEAPVPAQAALVFLLCAVCVLWFWNRKILPVSLVWLAVCALWVVACRGLYGLGYILHPLWIPLPVTAIYIGSIAANYVRAALEKQRVIGTFKRYVAPEVVNELLREDRAALGLGGKLTDIAVLFVDIRGFTPLSEVLQPPQVVEILNQYLSLTSECILENGGTLDKFIGDATMAIWGAPLPQADYVYKAVKTAVDMVERSKALRAKLEEQFGRTVEFGVGVHCGKAVVGNIGAQIRMDYTAIGDTVNTASRLEANAGGGEILISGAVAGALGGRVAATPLGRKIRLKGKSEELEILSVDRLE